MKENMNNDSNRLQKILMSASLVPDGLPARIMVRVEKAARKQTILRGIFGAVMSVIFASALVFAGREMFSEMTTSGFGQYLSLIFSDGASVAGDWRDLLWTLVESAPVVGLTLCLAAAGMLTAAVRWTGRTYGRFGGVASLRGTGMGLAL
jgi:hypothetical protein